MVGVLPENWLDLIPKNGVRDATFLEVYYENENAKHAV